MNSIAKIRAVLKGLMTRKRMGALAAAAAALFVTTSPAFAWFDNAWTFRKAITVDTKAGGVNGALANYPVLIRLDNSQFNFNDAQKNGADIRFVDSDDKTPLPFQVESFDPGLGLALVWVNIPDLQAASQHQIYLYYGNKVAQTASTPAKVFDTNYRGVYHFAANGVNTDSSPAHSDMAGAALSAASAIGAGADFTDQPANVSVAVNPQSGFTISFLEKERTPSANAVLFAARGASGSLVIGLKQSVPYIEVGTAHEDAHIPAITDWANVAVRGQGGKTQLSVNGQIVATINAPLPDITVAATLGADGGANPFQGQIDELRISNIVRSDAVVAADYASQRYESPMIGYGADEKASGVGFGYIGIAVANITFDGWIFIAILAAMGLWSWWTLWSRWLALGGVKKSNNQFLHLYREHDGSLTALDQALLQSAGDRKRIAQAPLYRIFRTGITELHKRGDLRGRILTEETVASIGAVLDSQQVTESQKLEVGTVFLSNCISTAPFIGLTGTVLGIIVTFAAMQMAGDASVSAVAPGLSGALVCTLAGLIVAVPASLGYNFITGKINAEIDKHRAFADIFITGLAEAQRDAAMAAAAE